MVIGEKNLDGDFYVQDNNPTENILRKFSGKLIKGWLETCGPSAACNCLAALGYNLEIKIPGKYIVQPEELLSDCMNDPKYAHLFEKVRANVINKIPGGRIPQMYPLAVELCYKAKAEFKWGALYQDVIRSLENERTIQVCMKKPGHYIAVLAYDEERKVFIYKDSWKKHKRNKNGGKNELMSLEEFKKNIAGYRVEYFK